MFNPLLLASLALLLVLPAPMRADITLPNVFGSIGNVGKAIVNPKLLPTPQGLLEGGKQLIAGYPFEFVSTTINTICSTALASNQIKSKVNPDITKMNFQLRTGCDQHYFPLLKAQSLWHSPHFDASKKVVILATGWTTNANESGTDIIDVLGKAYTCRGDTNFVVVDAGKLVDTLYTWSAFNTEEIGENIAIGLVNLLELVPLKNIHLIGHSLGAHIVGSAGRHLQLLANKTVPRITGLDPAKPCFNEGETLAGLQRGDADFIDIIHSNSGVLGKRDPTGDVDFYPGGLASLPPGCLTVTCAHARAWNYYAESVYPGNERNFLGRRCSSLTRVREDRCPGDTQPMGYAAPNNIRGNYFLDVNAKSPYGLEGSSTRTVSQERCGGCAKKK